MTAALNKDIIAHDLKTALHGKLEPAKLDAAVTQLTATNTAYSANGSVASMVFYLQFQVQMSINGVMYTFNGKGGGLSSPGGGALFGDVYTDNVQALIDNTVSFEFNCAFAYTSILFFDKNSNLLGSFQSGSVSTVAGVGGGSGEWTPKM